MNGETTTGRPWTASFSTHLLRVLTLPRSRCSSTCTHSLRSIRRAVLRDILSFLDVDLTVHRRVPRHIPPCARSRSCQIAPWDFRHASVTSGSRRHATRAPGSTTATRIVRADIRDRRMVIDYYRYDTCAPRSSLATLLLAPLKRVFRWCPRHTRFRIRCGGAFLHGLMRRCQAWCCRWGNFSLARPPSERRLRSSPARSATSERLWARSARPRRTRLER